MKQIIALFITTFLLGIGSLYAQERVVKGTILGDDQLPLVGATIMEKGTNNGTTTDVNGLYTIKVKGDAILVVRYIGFKETEINLGTAKSFDVTMELDQLEEVVIVGTRGAPRSDADTPVPVDVVGTKELAQTGQLTFDKALQYKIPSFNTVQTPVNDATSLLDPYEIRNMGPSRTLILINGKRKNLSSLLYTQTAPGRGETGADISAISTSAIKRVEILRDGASAQYGSDAIAGVMNIILKDDADYGSIQLNTGITSEGDGESFGLALNNGINLKDKGFLNYTIDLSKVYLANRPGTVNAEGDAFDFEADLATVEEFLSRKPDAGNINGSPETTAAKFLVNGGVNLNASSQLYFNAAYVYKKVNSFANYRTPYWRTVADMPYLADFFPAPGTPNGYDGYVPTFEGELNDYNATVGFKGQTNGWNHDVSLTAGGNSQVYTVSNSHNRNKVLAPATWVDENNNNVVDDGEVTQDNQLYRENSPVTFDVGGTAFNHLVGNLDISKRVVPSLSIGFGAEFRTEVFTVIEGILASYDGGGADSFAGNTPENSGAFNRYNLGGYFDLAWDITDNFLVNGTIRGENYSDFGNTFVWKLSSRYKMMDDKMTIRASASTGFRAPTLHQIYTQKAQYSFVPGQGIQVGGLVNNVSPQASLLGIPQLKAEKSTNLTAGLGFKPNSNFSVTLDYYNIAVEDRIVLSTEISGTEAGDTPLDQVLEDNNMSDVSFFVNAIDTRTSGIDFVASYRDLPLGTGFIGLNLSGNYTIQNEREGEVKNPKLVEDAGQSVVNATQEALFFTSRPKTKWIFGVDYSISKFNVAVNNTYFGKTTFKQQGLDENLRTEFTPKIVTDLSVTYNATEKLTIAANINNILNVLPEWKFVAENEEGQKLMDSKEVTASGLTPIEDQSNLITFNQRYSQMTYDGSHFSQLGTLFNLSVNYKF
ncbi:TonB-dependent receptor [Limibacter armeniacum]|uniref:TonB-dependent receptor n=1 Tax=Limibacter armeniacum TaxID=466084 RepID=UPI002FE67343